MMRDNLLVLIQPCVCMRLAGLWCLGLVQPQGGCSSLLFGFCILERRAQTLHHYLHSLVEKNPICPSCFHALLAHTSP